MDLPLLVVLTYLRLTKPVPAPGPKPGDLYAFPLTSTGGSIAMVTVGAPGRTSPMRPAW